MKNLKPRLHFVAILAIALSVGAEAKDKDKSKTSLGLCTEFRAADKDLLEAVDAIKDRSKETPRFQLRFNITEEEGGANKRVVTDLVSGKFDPKKVAPGLLPLSKPEKAWSDKPLA